jgi:hypothetical protein
MQMSAPATAIGGRYPKGTGQLIIGAFLGRSAPIGNYESDRLPSIASTGTSQFGRLGRRRVTSSVFVRC